MSKEIPKMPKEGLMLPFFDKPEDIPPDMASSDKAVVEKLGAEVQPYLLQLIAKHKVNDINREGYRKMLPQERGWLEMFYIHGKVVLVAKYWVEDGGIKYLISLPGDKEGIIQS